MKIAVVILNADDFSPVVLDNSFIKISILIILLFPHPSINQAYI